MAQCIVYKWAWESKLREKIQEEINIEGPHHNGPQSSELPICSPILLQPRTVATNPGAGSAVARGSQRTESTGSNPRGTHFLAVEPWAKHLITLWLKASCLQNGAHPNSTRLVGEERHRVHEGILLLLSQFRCPRLIQQIAIHSLEYKLICLYFISMSQLTSLHNCTASANGTKMCSKHNEASHTIFPAAAGQDVAPNSVEASRMGLSKQTKDLQHQSMQMKGQL